MALRSNVVVIVYRLSHVQATPQANTSELPSVTPYVRDCLSLLSSAGLPS